MDDASNDMVTPSERVGALARRNNLSVDAFSEIAETRLSDFSTWTTNVLGTAKHELTTLDHLIQSCQKAEKENSAKQKSVNVAIETSRKEIVQKQVRLRREEVHDGFMKSVLKSKGFWCLSGIAALFMGTWNFVVWRLVRSRIVDLTDIIGGVITYFAGYVNGIPVQDIIFIVGSGTSLSFIFWAIYVSMYHKNHISSPSRDWKKYEFCAVSALVFIELVLTVYSVYAASLAGLTNKRLSDIPLAMISFESFVFIAFWILFHFLVYKYWIAYIRDSAGKVSGEIYLIEIREEINKSIKKRTELETVDSKVKVAAETIKQERVTLKARLLAFKVSEYGIAATAVIAKNAVVDFSHKWLLAARDEFTLTGNSSSYVDYEVTIKNVVARITEAIDTRARKSTELLERFREQANRLLAVLDGTQVILSPVTAKLLPYILLPLSMAIVSGCAENVVYNPQTGIQRLNVLVAIDPSDRFLKDEDSLYLPVAFDLSVIETAYNEWEQIIISAYDQGIDVAQVEGEFWVVPIPTPHESRRTVSSLGFGLELSDLPTIKRWDHLVAQKDSVVKRSSLIYETALTFEPEGADIWAFFRDLDSYLKQRKDSVTWQNKMILLTDGYPYLEKGLKKQRRSNGCQRDYLDEGDMDKLRASSNWEKEYLENHMGFLPIGHIYDNLDVLVIGLNEPLTLQGSAKEFEIIKRYWTDFFESMGIKHYSFVRLNSPATTKIIRDFIKS